MSEMRSMEQTQTFNSEDCDDEDGEAAPEGSIYYSNASVPVGASTEEVQDPRDLYYPQHVVPDTKVSILYVDFGSSRTKLWHYKRLDQKPNFVEGMSIQGVSKLVAHLTPEELKLLPDELKIGPYYGKNIMDRLDILELRYPLSRSVSEDYTAVERIWRETFYSSSACKIEETTVVLLEALLSPAKHRQEMARIMFDFGAKRFMAVARPVLAVDSMFTPPAPKYRPVWKFKPQEQRLKERLARYEEKLKTKPFNTAWNEKKINLMDRLDRMEKGDPVNHEEETDPEEGELPFHEPPPEPDRPLINYIPCGIFVDTGNDETFAVPVHNGQVLISKVGRSQVAGRHITERLLKLLTPEDLLKVGGGRRYAEQATRELASKMKETVCCVQMPRHLYRYRDRRLEGTDVQSYDKIAVPDAWKCAEPLFDKRDGIQRLVLRTAEQVGELGLVMLRNVVAAGGSALLKGFKARLQYEIYTAAPAITKRIVGVPQLWPEGATEYRPHFEKLVRVSVLEYWPCHVGVMKKVMAIDRDEFNKDGISAMRLQDETTGMDVGTA